MGCFLAVLMGSAADGQAKVRLSILDLLDAHNLQRPLLWIEWQLYSC